MGAGRFGQLVRGVTDEADGVGEGLAERPEGASRGTQLCENEAEGKFRFELVTENSGR